MAKVKDNQNNSGDESPVKSDTLIPIVSVVGMRGLSSRDSIFLCRKYKGESKTLLNWDKEFVKLGIKFNV